MPRYYGAFLDVKGRRCAVIGGDEHEALRKVRYLIQCGADVTVIAPTSETCAALTELARSGEVVHVSRRYRRGDLSGMWLAIVADTSDVVANEVIREEAEQHNILLNVMDVTHLCNFIAPALVHRGDVTVAVSTAGTSPALARRLRERMSDTEYCQCLQWADLGPILSGVRAEVRSNKLPLIPDDWAVSITDVVLAEFQSGNPEKARQTLLDALHQRADLNAARTSE